MSREVGGYITKGTHSKQNRWKISTIVSILIIVALIIYIIVATSANVNGSSSSVNAEQHQKTPCKQHIELGEPHQPSIFHDLTRQEISGLMDYLHAEPSLKLVAPSNLAINTSYIYTAELYLPPKSEVLSFLDKKTSKPNREAIVTIFRGDQNPPFIEEKIVGPLPNPNYLNDVPGRRKKIPYTLRPFSGPDLKNMFISAETQLHREAKELLVESFGASFDDCGAKCLALRFPSPLSSAVTGENKKMFWLNVVQFVEYFALYPVDFGVLVDVQLTGTVIKEIWYNGNSFKNISELVQKYNDREITKIKIPFPEANKESFSILSQRGTPFQDMYQREPVQVEPDGKRYSVKHNHVEYRGWSFDYRMSVSTGPQLYDIRYRNERIVYEISLQEILVFYSGYKPSVKFTNYFDSLDTLGMSARSLVPGVDCPFHATFIDNIHVIESSKEPVNNKGSFCLFEFTKDLPLRRHHSYRQGHGYFYEGLSNSVLILRAILSVANYDYIFDFIFYQNGVVEVKAISTGYIFSTYPTEGESDFGFKLHEFVNGNMHIHAFSFKIDIDVKGTSNRYESVDVVPYSSANPFHKNTSEQYHSTKMVRNLKKTEKDAAYKFNFDRPKHLLFYNNEKNNSYGGPSAYRIVNKGMAKMLYPEGLGNEPSASWTRYQLAVTKHKDTERKSSSPFAYLDSSDPVVQFQKYLDDDDSIVDEDLVAWVTLGIHHIPHMEDLPVTTTPGKELSFFLLPFNYFPEDPAMASRQSVRIETNVNEGISISQKPSAEGVCQSSKPSFFQNIVEKPETFFDL